MLEAARLRIRGRVQGVFYRRSAEDEANRLAISGWVRNMSDGSVEAFALGPRASLEKFIDWCGKGPPGARVESVDVEWRSLEATETPEDEKVAPGSRFSVTGSW